MYGRTCTAPHSLHVTTAFKTLLTMQWYALNSFDRHPYLRHQMRQQMSLACLSPYDVAHAQSSCAKFILAVLAISLELLQIQSSSLQHSDAACKLWVVARRDWEVLNQYNHVLNCFKALEEPWVLRCIEEMHEIFMEVHRLMDLDVFESAFRSIIDDWANEASRTGPNKRSSSTGASSVPMAIFRTAFTAFLIKDRKDYVSGTKVIPLLCRAPGHIQIVVISELGCWNVSIKKLIDRLSCFFVKRVLYWFPLRSP